MSNKVGLTNNSSDKCTKSSFHKFMWSKEIMHQLLKQAETKVWQPEKPERSGGQTDRRWPTDPNEFMYVTQEQIYFEMFQL